MDYKKSNSNKPIREALKLKYSKKNSKFKVKKFEVPKRNNNENEFDNSNFNKNNSNYKNFTVNNYLNIIKTENKTEKHINFIIKNKSRNNLFSRYKNGLSIDNNHKRKITDFSLYDKLDINNNIMKSPLYIKTCENFYSDSKQKRYLNDKNINSIRRNWI